MTRREFFRRLSAAAQPLYGDREAEAIARVVMESFGISRLDMALEPGVDIPDGIDVESICLRLAEGCPVQYITGYTVFCGLRFEVGPAVLIPRPETEELVRWIISDRDGDNPVKILDIGTGSGAIAVALAKGIPTARLTALDVSAPALAAASRNAGRNDAEVVFKQEDILNLPLGNDNRAIYDVIVSNPPYIPHNEIRAMHTNVTGHEPHLALFVPDNDPLLFYTAIAVRGLHMLADGGSLYFEVHENHAGDVAAMLRGSGYKGVEIRRDLNGRERMVKAKK